MYFLFKGGTASSHDINQNLLVRVGVEEICGVEGTLIYFWEISIRIKQDFDRFG